MKKNNNKTDKRFTQIIEPTPMPAMMAEDFRRYAKAVLSDRAIPDVRDGLKPVQRRIIFGMAEEGNTFDKPTKKSATTVGYVMGNYHPHGDSSIYDALVRLSQDWKMEVPLVTFQGNNGSIDNDPAAASRYTEAKLSKIAGLMVEDLDKDTVAMQLNFSDERLEPTVLPAKFPNLLVNGAQGIAVGAVTNIPTHNLGEVIDATIYAIQHKRATVSDLRQFIKGPDFPTGGFIDQPEDLNKLYETGSGTFYIHANAKVDSEKNQIIITDVPYGTIKSDFVANLDKAKDSYSINNIEEVRDESTEEVRIAIDVKEGQDPEPILSFLRSKGLLRTTFAANMLAIDKGHPRTMNLLDIIRAYIDHQVDVNTRCSKFMLNKDTKRLEVVSGLVRCVSIVDQVVKVIKNSKGKADSKNNIMKEFNFTSDQAEAIIMLNLYKINSLDAEVFIDESKELKAEIEELNKLLSDSDYMDKHIIKGLKAVKEEYAKPRKTTILDAKIETQDVDISSLISKEDVYLVVTKDGYLKRSSEKSHQASISGNLVDDLPKIKPGDGIVLSRKCSTHDGLICFLSSGTFIYIPVFLVPEAKWKEEGKHLNVLIKNLVGTDRVVSAFVINTFEPKCFFALLSASGKIKKTALKEFEQSKLTSRSIKCMALSKDDELVKVVLTSGNSDLLVMQSNGYVSRYNENEVPTVGIKAGGVKAINLGKGNAHLTDLVSLSSDEREKLIIITDKGAIRAIMSSNIDTTPRLSIKEDLVKIFKSSPMSVISLAIAPDKKADGKNEIGIYTETDNIVVDVSSLETVLPGSGMKPNIKLPNDNPVKGIHQVGGLIDSSVKVETPKMVVSEVKAKEDSGAKQLSLFDLFDEEDKTQK